MQKKQKVRIFLYVAALATLAASLALFAFLLHKRSRGSTPEDAVVIAVPYSEWVQDYESNYYTRWLIEKTGYEISFVYLDENYEKESLNLMLTSENSRVDAVFFPMNQEILSVREYQDYIRGGYLASPQDYLKDNGRLSAVEAACPGVDFERLRGEDGRFYCFPSLSPARVDRNLQILWINMDWLKALGLKMPQTVGEFEETLIAFRDGDPNGNGLSDEIPLVSCGAENALHSYLYLINSFTYYDGTSLPWYGRAEEAAEAEAFRQALSYCARLYEQKLLLGGDFPKTKKQLMELVNDPADLVGAFASHSIADVVYATNPDILAHFGQLTPLSSDILEKGYAINAEPAAGIGGMIPANAAHKEAAARIMDVMLSEEASLIALYGEKGTDWRFSEDRELSTYGTHARITTIRYIKGERQNKNYNGIGPLFVAAEYMDGVTWNGDHSMIEYIDARAVKAYEAYYRTEQGGARAAGLGKLAGDEPEETEIWGFRAAGTVGTGDSARIDGTSREAADQENALREYLETEVLRFITGDRDIENDEDWAEFLAGYGRISAHG